jgi:DNA-binding NarL/FixJ family response regulator
VRSALRVRWATPGPGIRTGDEVTRNKVIRVGIADDQPLVHRGMEGLIESADGIVMIGEASEAEAILELVDENPDVVVIDLMGNAERLELTRAIAERNPAVGIVVITDPLGPDVPDDALRAGAKGLVARTTPGGQLLQAVRMVANGNVVIDAATWEIFREAGTDPSPEAVVHLTGRELDVLRLLARGYTNRQIGDDLGVADETVKTHLMRIFRRLGVGNRTDAVVKALRAGIVD